MGAINAKCLLLLFLIGCVSSVEPTLLSTAFLQIVDNNDRPLSGAQVFVFNSKQAFDNASDAGVFNLSIQTTTSDNFGNVTVTGLTARQSYYLYAIHTDTIGNDYSNGTKFNTIFIPKTGTFYSAKVPVKIAESTLVFWVPTSVTGSSNFIVEFGDRVFELQSKRPTEPTAPYQENTLTIARNPGRFRVRTRYADGNCVSQQDIVLTKKSNLFIPFQNCDYGSIQIAKSFAANVELVLNLTDTVRKAIPQLPPISCSNAQSSLQVYRAPGTYTYIARSGSCFWSGQVVVSNSECGIIYLDNCE